MARFIIEIIDGFQGAKLEPRRVAYVYKREKGWPTQKMRHEVALVGSDDADTANQLNLWFKWLEQKKAEET